MNIYCPHCEDFVPKTTYYRHRQQFCKADGEWSDAFMDTSEISMGPIESADEQ